MFTFEQTRVVLELKKRRSENWPPSFKTQGVLEPLLVRPLEESTFEVVIGARRLNSRMYPPEMGIDDKLDKVLEKLSQASLVCDDCHLVGDVDRL